MARHQELQDSDWNDSVSKDEMEASRAELACHAGRAGHRLGQVRSGKSLHTEVI